MSPTVARQIKSLTPRKQILRYAASGAQVLNLTIDAEDASVYSNDVQSNAARYERATATA